MRIITNRIIALLLVALSVCAAWSAPLNRSIFDGNIVNRLDVNGDGQVTVADVSIIYDNILGVGDASEAADVNGDGEVTVADVTKVFSGIQGQIVDEYSADGLFRRCYAVMAVTGPNGANGYSDINGFDGSSCSFTRQMWNLNELPTDEAICGWGDWGVSDLNYGLFTEKNPMANGYFARLYHAIDLCDYYLEQYSGYDAEKTAEVRFLRAMYYYFAMDAFGNIPLHAQSKQGVVTYSYIDENGVEQQVSFTIFSTASDGGYSYPNFDIRMLSGDPQMTRSEAYSFIESELLAAVQGMAEPSPKTSASERYGRADKAAAWTILSRLYLNAEVYTGTPQWTKAAQYAKLVMDSPYKLLTADKAQGDWTAYHMLFMGDNGETEAAKEAILPIPYDSSNTAFTTWGGTMFLLASTYNSDMHENPYNKTDNNGLSQCWAGNRARKQLSLLLLGGNQAPNGQTGYYVASHVGDDRALLNTYSSIIENENVEYFTNGYGVAKYNNFKVDGSSAGGDFPDTDLFLLRKAEAYLTYAEALTRSNGGSVPAAAVDAINTVRARANAQQRYSYSLDDILDEWGREFYFEGRRRTDLVRFGKFGGENAYTWSWKGGKAEGAAIAEFRNVYPLPQSALQADSLLTQNPGYNPLDHDIVVNNMTLTVEPDVPPMAVTFRWNAPADSAQYKASSPHYTLTLRAGWSTMTVDTDNTELTLLISDIQNGLYTLREQVGEVEVTAQVSTPGDEYYVSFTTPETPFNINLLKVETQRQLWWIVGSMNGWDNRFGSLIPTYADPSNPDVLTYAGYFAAGDQFKFVRTPGDWGTQLNYYDGMNLDSELFESADSYNYNIGVKQSGYYLVTIYLQYNYFTIVPYTASTPAVYSTITHPGDYNGWEVTANPLASLSQNVENHDWKGTVTFPSSGGCKFAAGTWATDWGGSSFPIGVGVRSGANIPCKAGTYTVFFNDILGAYMFLDNTEGYYSTSGISLLCQSAGVVDATTGNNAATTKLCDITTNIGSDELKALYAKFGDGTFMNISLAGEVDTQQLRDYIDGHYNRAMTGHASLGITIVAVTNDNRTASSDQINVTANLDTYAMLLADGTRIEMSGSATPTATILATGSDIIYTVVPASATSEAQYITPVTSGYFTETSGSITQGSGGRFVIPYTEGDVSYRVTFNPGGASFNVERIAFADFIYVGSDGNNWGADPLKLTDDSKRIYEGYCYLGSEFKLRLSPANWNVYWGGTTSALERDGNNISTPGEGFYYITVNLSALTCDLQAITTIGLIGGFDGNMWASDYAKLTYNQTTGAWEGEASIPAGVQFKFRANDYWLLNWGGPANNLSRDGANLTLAESGDYKISMRLTYPGNCSVTFEKQ